MNNPTDENQPSSGEELAPEETQEEEESQEQTQTSKEEKPKRDRSLDGRLKELDTKLSELRELEKRLGERERVPMPPVQQPGTQLTPQEVEAQNLLKGKLGFADKETVQKEIENLEARLTLNSKHDSLERTFDGSDGRPKYDRGEVENFMRQRGDIFDPETAYEKMYRQELLDWEVKRATSGKKTQPYSAKQSLPVKGEDGAITAEKVAEMQKKGKEIFLPWYTKNRDKILALHAEGKL